LPLCDVTTPPFVLSVLTGTPHRCAAAIISRSRAIAAAVRTGVYIERVELDPPVSWLNISSGRASARVTCTLSIGRSSSSAMSWATRVVMPCPTSARGSANDAVPSVLSWIEIMVDVDSAARSCRSPRSKSSSGWGSDGIAASAACGAIAPAPTWAATTSVGAAIR